MSAGIGNFLSEYRDMFTVIWSFAYDETDIINSIKHLNSLVKCPVSNTYRIYLIEKYFKKANTVDKIDIGVNELLKQHCITNYEFDFITDIFINNKYKPSIGCVLRNYINECTRGRLGVVEIMFICLQNNYINKIPNRQYQELAYWLILQYGHNMTDYHKIIKFSELAVFRKPFNLDSYTFCDFKNLLYAHSVILGSEFLEKNKTQYIYNPVNINFTFGKNFIDSNMFHLYELIIPSLDRNISLCNIVNTITYMDTVYTETSGLFALKQFLTYCETSTELNDFFEDIIEELYNKIDPMIMWLFLCYGANMVDTSTELHKYLVRSKHDLRVHNFIQQINMLSLHKYVKYHQIIISQLYETYSKVSAWMCTFCTFQNTNIMANKCDVCDFARF